MTTLRDEQIERRLEQSRRLFRCAADPKTAHRIGVLIDELEHEQQIEKEK
jgi:hypothetical protein